VRLLHWLCLCGCMVHGMATPACVLICLFCLSQLCFHKHAHTPFCGSSVVGWWCLVVVVVAFPFPFPFSSTVMSRSVTAALTARRRLLRVCLRRMDKASVGMLLLLARAALTVSLTQVGVCESCRLFPCTCTCTCTCTCACACACFMCDVTHGVSSDVNACCGCTHGFSHAPSHLVPLFVHSSRAFLALCHPPPGRNPRALPPRCKAQ